MGAMVPAVLLWVISRHRESCSSPGNLSEAGLPVTMLIPRPRHQAKFIVFQGECNPSCTPNCWTWEPPPCCQMLQLTSLHPAHFAKPGTGLNSLMLPCYYKHFDSLTQQLLIKYFNWWTKVMGGIQIQFLMWTGWDPVAFRSMGRNPPMLSQSDPVYWGREGKEVFVSPLMAMAKGKSMQSCKCAFYTPPFFFTLGWFFHTDTSLPILYPGKEEALFKDTSQPSKTTPGWCKSMWVRGLA